ncbi:MAG: FeoB-associated Cys-rich membrane protein [Lachnospiraceae bacterium]|nr:FeoB-associated Cys-rich membrane protein [Lachnospiraceae bacterium]
MADLIVILILLIIIGAAIVFIVREKKRGVKCIGCPAAGQCARKSCGGCSGQNDGR